MSAPAGAGSTNPGEQRSGPLADLVVLDFTLALSGPFATLLLAGMGARVIKIEPPDGPYDPARGNAPFFGRDGVSMRAEHATDRSIAYLDRGRGKESITLDLKHPAAAEVVADLARASHLVVQNWSAGVAARLGVDHATLATFNPRIVVCSISGFGLDVGPAETVTPKAMDTIIQAMSGMMLSAGSPGDPPMMNGIPITDLVTPLFALIGALAAVRAAEHTGIGQLVDVSMLGAASALVAVEPHGAYEHLGIGSRPGQSLPRLAPFGTFATLDGHVALCAPTDQFAHEVLLAIGADPADPRFTDRSSRVTNRGELDAAVGEWTAARPTDEVVAELTRRGVPAAPVRSPVEAVNDPLVVRRGEVVPIEDRDLGIVPGVMGSGMPIRFSGTAPGPLRLAVEVGTDNDAVYRDLLGYDDERCAALHAAGVI